MSNPISRPAAATWPKGPGQATDNLSSLASGAAKGLGSVGTTLTAYYDDIVHQVKIKTGTSTSGTGTASLYLVTSGDNSVWTNGIDPDSTSDQSTKLHDDFLVEKIDANADSTTYYFGEFSLSERFGYIPTYWAIVIFNQSGAALSATASDHSAKHTQDAYA